jgi:hypothetical protein
MTKGGVMDTAQRISFLEQNLARQLAWIAAAESKISFILGLDTAMLGLLAGSLGKHSAWTVTVYIFGGLTAVLGVASLLFLSFASFPRTKGPDGSLVYFGTVAKREVAQFRAEVCDLSIPEYVDDLCSQCHRNAEIAKTKYVSIKWALHCLYLSVIPWGLALYFVYGSRK